MQQAENPVPASDHLALAGLVWDEYKYRHELCWDLVIKFTVVGTALSVIPYLDQDLVIQAEFLKMLTPAIALLFLLLGINRLYRELQLLDKIRSTHRKFQNEFVFTEAPFPSRNSTFTWFVLAYMIIFILLVIANGIMVIWLLQAPQGAAAG